MNGEKNTNIDTITNYRCELTFDDETTCTITSSSLDGVQSRVRKLLVGAKLRFEITGSKNQQQELLAIYSESHFNSQQPIGWIAAFDVPVNMSVKSVTRARLAQQKVA